MNDQELMMGLLREVDEAAATVIWEAIPVDHGMAAKDPTVKWYRGNTQLWVFTVISFNIEDQGHPKGSRGYDGTGVRNHDAERRGTVLHLTRELSEKLFKMAEEKAGT